MERIAVRGRQRDRFAHPFNPNHFPVVQGGGDSHRFDQRVGGSIREKLLLTLVGRRCFARA